MLSQTPRHGEQSWGCQWGAMGWKFGISRSRLLHTGWINSVLLYSAGNCIQYPVITIMEKDMKKNTYQCVCWDHFSVRRKSTQYGKSTILKKKKD